MPRYSVHSSTESMVRGGREPYTTTVEAANPANALFKAVHHEEVQEQLCRVEVFLIPDTREAIG